MIKYNQFIKELEDLGCHIHRTNGKHHVWRHPKLSRNIVITKAKTVSPGLYHSTLKLVASVN